eukprot:CAMPEP_0195291676 /NCGR_PEP_ID=MMETSP0707-20130614/8039_1 /TAXON_ID=33640 /ORGANISM="Asterionellopsis glacialis, Strain CCMP134" /LENGTH=205 /DNA_ID=CAMNT_0040352015 /DNA_START=149 /DNA_END=766 /DNA_ORIENTATION=+
MASNNQGSSQPPRRRYPRRGSVTEHTLRAQRQVIRDMNNNATPFGQRDIGHNVANAPGESMDYEPTNQNLTHGDGDGLIVDFPTSRSVQPDSYREDPNLTQAPAGYYTSTANYNSMTINQDEFHNQDDIMMDPDQHLTGWNPNYGDNVMRVQGRRDSAGSSMYSGGRRDSAASSAYSFNDGGAAAAAASSRRDSMGSTFAAYSDR